LPREVWCEKSRVQDPADGTVEKIIWQESSMSTFMTKDLAVLVLGLQSDHGSLPKYQ